MKLDNLWNEGACGVEQALYLGEINFDDDGLDVGLAVKDIGPNMVITRIICKVLTAFNAGTNNQITLGTDTGISNLLGVGDNPDGAPASAILNPVGDNNNIVITAKHPGTAGNAISVALVDPTQNNSALVINLVGDTINVMLATDGAGAIISTAAEVIAAINSALVVKDLVSAANAADNDGTGVVTAINATALTGGTDGCNHKVGVFSKSMWFETGSAKKTIKAKYAQTGTDATAGKAEFYAQLLKLPG